MEENKVLILDVHEKPKTKFKWFVLSLQHVFAMFGATVLVPFLTGLPVSVALFSSGVGTLIYILCTGAKVPVYLGSSFAYIGVICSVSSQYGSYGPVMTGLLVVGLIYLVFSLLIKVFGKTWINQIFPPIVIGPAIMIIGLSLASSAVKNAGLLDANLSQNWKSILVAAISFATVVIVSIRGKGFLKIIPFVLGIVAGFIASAILGLVDFNAPILPLNNLSFLEIITDPGKWFKIPSFMFLSWFDDTKNVLGTTITFQKVNLAAVLTIAPLAFVTACEHIGDHAVLGKVCGKDFLQNPGLDKTLAGSGVASIFAALIGGPANTTYGENTSVVGMTRVGSVWVTGLAAVIAVIFSFVNVFVAFINIIPVCVMGGMSIILYGFITLNGLRVLSDSNLDLSEMKNVIIISAMLVLGIGGATINLGDFSITSTTLAVIVGVLLNVLFVIIPNKIKNK